MTKRSKAMNFSDVTPEISGLAQLCQENSSIDPTLYSLYDVKRGLRDVNGSGVLAGLTEVSEIIAFHEKDGEKIPCDGELCYRGIDIRDLTRGFLESGRFGFEEIAYLLLIGSLPTAAELDGFKAALNSQMSLPKNFVRDVIMKAPSGDIMNSVSRSVLTLASYDHNAGDISLENVMRQCLMLTATFPMLAVYSYQAYNYYGKGHSFFIHDPDPDKSAAENLLRLLRPDMNYTRLEAAILDLALVLHMEHGGGNNSTFTTHVVTSSGADTYSVMTAALSSLKGPKHGGANIKVVQMFDDLRANVSDIRDERQVEDYLRRLVRKEVFDRKGLIYGMGHAVYSVSDPRAQILKAFAEELAAEKGRQDDYALYTAVERLAPRIIAEERRIYKGVSANVDFYSGFVYSMLGIPAELYTPIFAYARLVGWSAHRMEELINMDKIIRPAYRCVLDRRPYRPMGER